MRYGCWNNWWAATVVVLTFCLGGGDGCFVILWVVDSGVFCGSGCVFGLVLRVCFWWFVNSLWPVVCVVSDALIGLWLDVR